MANKKSIGLPGGPNEYITHVSEMFSTDGYKRNSPDVNNPYNIIPSADITMKDVDFPVRGYGNNGIVQDMIPGKENYNYGDADYVVEVPMAKTGGGLLTKTMKCNSCGWEWKAADGGADVSTCHKCGGSALPKAQTGLETVNEDTPIQLDEAVIKADKEKSSLNKWGHGILDAAGLIPGFGEIADGANALWYAAEGDNTNAALSAAAMVPFLGWGATATKFGLKGLKGLKGAKNVAEEVVENTVKVADNVKPSWSRGVTNYGRSPEGIQDALRSMKSQGKHLDEIGFNVDDVIAPNVINHGNKFGRQIAEVALPNGQSQLFYKSSGLAGKKGAGKTGTTEGLWQPYGGHASTGATDNWFIKDAGYENFYDSNSFKAIANKLDEIESGWDMSKQVLKSKLKYGGIPKAQNGNGEYKVASGDTFYGIANKNNLPWEALKDANPNLDYDNLKLNQSIVIPNKINRSPGDPKTETPKKSVQNFQITPELLLKQAYVESLLNPKAKNDLGYKGIAQIGDDLIADYKKANKVESVDPFDAQQNHDVQEWSMNELYNSSFVDKPTSTAENRLLKSLASYNWGRGKLLKLLNEEKASGADIYTKTDWTEKLPQQTKDYINMIVYDGSTEKRPQVQENFIKATKDDKYKEIRDIYKYQYGGELIDEQTNNAVVQDNTYVNRFIARDFFPSLTNQNKSINDYKFDFSDYNVEDDQKSSDNNVENNHVVAKGENLGLIAKKYNTSVSEIASLNNIQDPNLININQKLKLPNIEVSDKKEYVIKAGDTLNEIAKKHGTTSNKLAEINGIEDINVISINQRLQLPDNYIDEVSLAEESWISTDKLKQNRKDINGGNDESIVVKSQMLNDPNQRYVVIDKKSQRLKLYQGDNVLMDFEVGTGQNVGDAQTVTKNKYIDPYGNTVTPKEAFIEEEKDGKIVYEKLKPGYKSKVDWSAGNKQTGAGKFTMGNVGKYKDTPSFTLVNENGIEIPAVIHATLNSRKKYFDNDNIEDNRMSNGCINGKCTDLEALYNTGLPAGSPVFILPEEDGNYFEFADGQAVLRTGRQNRIDAENYTDSQGREQKGQGINRSTNTLKYKEIRPVFDEEKFKEDKFTYFDFNDTKEYEGTVKPFVNSLVDNKQKIMEVAGISSDEYNEIAQIAFGILGNETNFGDTHSELGNAFRGVRKKYLDPKSSSPDYKRKFDGYSFAEGADNDYNSTGLTQLRYQEVKNEGKKRDSNGNILASERDKVMPAEKMFNDLGITSNADLMDPEKAAIATVARLAFLVNNRKGVDKNDLMNTLPGFWGGSSKDGKATYTDNVKKNSKYLKLQQLDRVLPTNEEGGEINEFDIYQGYLNGKYDGTEQEQDAENIYDKLNRKHYREAKMHGMTPSNFIATHFLNKA